MMLSTQLWPNSTAVIIGTGPSLTDAQLEWAARKAREQRWRLFGMNNVYQRFPWIDVLVSCNVEWWDHYHPRDLVLRTAKFDRWTWDLATAHKYGINYVEGRWGDSLSVNPRYIHYGHSSSYQALGLAYHYGVRTMYLLGFDMKYPPGQPRHYFGEYPKPLQHFPRTGPNGEFTGLIKQFETIDCDALGLTVYNCTPGSALRHFPGVDYESV